MPRETHGRGFAEAAIPFQRRDIAAAGTLEVQASVAKTHFAQLLDEVERGTTIVILRHGRPIGRLVPDEEGRRRRVAEAIENMKKLARERTERFGPVTTDEIVSSIHEGHKY